MPGEGVQDQNEIPGRLEEYSKIFKQKQDGAEGVED